MKFFRFALIFLWIFILPKTLKAGHEFLVRLGPQFGILARIQETALETAVKRFAFINPEAHLEYQIAGPWFVSFSFHYFFLDGERSGNMDIFAPTAGLKFVSFEESSMTGDFFDRTRWWLGLESGPYITRSHLYQVIPRGSQTDFGFNLSAGFDSFFKRHWAVGFQAKVHFVNYDPDDYLFLSFGPNLIFRF